MPATRQSLADDLRRLGIRPGDLLMIHGAMRQVGRIVGGVNSLIYALLDVISPSGTIAAYVDYEPFVEDDDDPASVPVFDKRIAHAALDHGILHEALRTWPDAIRSDHPDAGVLAIGPLAAHITAEHPFQYGYGPGSPLEKIAQANGRVLMVGAPLDTITLLHYAEHIAELPGKRIRRYRRLMPSDNGPQWIDFEEFDTTHPVLDCLPENCFEMIAQAYLDAGNGRSGLIGNAQSYLFEGNNLVSFAVTWLRHYVQKIEALQESHEAN